MEEHALIHLVWIKIHYHYTSLSKLSLSKPLIRDTHFLIPAARVRISLSFSEPCLLSLQQGARMDEEEKGDCQLSIRQLSIMIINIEKLMKKMG